MSKHAILSPSGFKAIMLCPAKPAMERGLPDQSSSYADEGTKAHALAASVLMGEVPPSDTDLDMLGHVFTYTNTVKDYQGPDGQLFVEQAVPIDHITGEEDAKGTADAVILRSDEITIVDLKYGMGVEVSAERNPQLMLYALGVLEMFYGVDDFKRVRMVICQPRVTSAPSEYTMPVWELREWGEKVAKPAADAARTILGWENQGGVIAFCNPVPDACRFCKAKPCAAYDRAVEKALGAEFTDLTTADQAEKAALVDSLTHRDNIGNDQLGAKMDAVELVEMWCKAIRARVESRLLEGQDVAGYKLVQGKRGARAWADEAEAEKTLKAMRLKKDQMYDFKIISPTTAEKVLKATPKRWAKVQDLIKQSEGKPSVAPISDKRPALEIKPMASEFEAIGDDVGDLV